MFDWLAVGYLNVLGFVRLSSHVSLILNDEPAQITALDPDTNHKRSTNLGQLLDECPSLKGRFAWFTPTFWLLR